MTGQFVKEISIDWNRIDDNSYLRSIPALQFDGPITFDGNVTFFVGENGSGKSTLLEAIAVAYGFNPEGGTRNYNFTTYDSHSQLHQAIRVVKGIRRPKGSYFLRAESFYNVASQAEEYRDGEPVEIHYERFGGKSFHQQSHGESFLLGAQILTFDDGQIHSCGYLETESYQVTEMFINNREYFLKRLLGDE